MEQPKQFPGVTAQVQPVTQYVQPVSTAMSQVLGYLQPITSEEMKKRGLPETGFSGVDLVGQAGLEGQYDLRVRVHGGGLSGQAGAVRHGVARALAASSRAADFVVNRHPRMCRRQ